MSVIGAGNFARAVIIPALRKTRSVTLHSGTIASGAASESARLLFGFARAVQQLAIEEAIVSTNTISLHRGGFPNTKAKTEAK